MATTESDSKDREVIMILPGGRTYHVEGCPRLKGRHSNAYVSWPDVLKDNPKARPCKNCHPDEIGNPAKDIITRLVMARNLLVVVRDTDLPKDVKELVNSVVLDLGLCIYYLRNDSR